MRGPGPNSRFVRLGKITVGYGGKTNQEAFHGGVDIAAAEGTPIKAPLDGVVVKTDEGHFSGENNFGNQLELKDPTGKVHQFNHLQNIVAKKGQQVRKGAPIATVGKSGAVYSPSGSDPSNLDYRITDAFGRYMNPIEYTKDL